VVPAGLARAPHHEQVARRRREVDRRAACLRVQQERAAGAERDDGNESVVDVA